MIITRNITIVKNDVWRVEEQLEKTRDICVIYKFVLFFTYTSAGTSQEV